MTRPASPIPNAARRPSPRDAWRRRRRRASSSPRAVATSFTYRAPRRLHPRRERLEVVRDPFDVVRRDDDALLRETEEAVARRARTRRRRGRTRRRARRRGARRPRAGVPSNRPPSPRERSVARRVRPRNAARSAGRSGASPSASRRTSTAGTRRVDEARGLDQRPRSSRGADRGDEKRLFCGVRPKTRPPRSSEGVVAVHLALPRALGRLASDERVALAVATRDASARGPGRTSSSADSGGSPGSLSTLPPPADPLRGVLEEDAAATPARRGSRRRPRSRAASARPGARRSSPRPPPRARPPRPRGGRRGRRPPPAGAPRAAAASAGESWPDSRAVFASFTKPKRAPRAAAVFRSSSQPARTARPRLRDPRARRPPTRRRRPAAPALSPRRASSDSSRSTAEAAPWRASKVKFSFCR